jgi:hypothetical protein
MTPNTSAARRNAANMTALRSGVPAHQSGIDAFWGDIAEKLNATLPRSQEAIEVRRASSTTGGAKPSHATVDWTTIAANLNAEAGLSSPVRTRA